VGAIYGANERQENLQNILVGNTEGKRPVGGPRNRCEDNINVDFKGTDWEAVD
jgi:hypothetical protein